MTVNPAFLGSWLQALQHPTTELHMKALPSSKTSLTEFFLQALLSFHLKAHKGFTFLAPVPLSAYQTGIPTRPAHTRSPHPAALGHLHPLHVKTHCSVLCTGCSPTTIAHGSANPEHPHPTPCTLISDLHLPNGFKNPKLLFFCCLPLYVAKVQ